MPAHTVLFSSRAPIGYIAIADQEVCTNQGFKSVVPNEETDYMFLYYLLKYNKDKSNQGIKLFQRNFIRFCCGESLQNVRFEIDKYTAIS